MANKRPTIGGRYILSEMIGAGSMGEVFKATDRLTGDVIALKSVTILGEQLQSGSTASPSSVRENDLRLALTQEFKTLASLHHPHIISVHDYGFDENRLPYFTMDYLASAQTITKAGYGQSPERQIELVVQLLQALAYLHRHGVIHRDLKPGNVLVVDGQVKVLDFGLAIAQELVDKEDADFVGTIAYVAPEILMGKTATEASDLYAVGMMAYEMIAGKHPFEGESLSRMMANIMGVIPDVQALGIDEQIAAVLLRLLAKAPDQRYGNARDLIIAYARAANRDDLVQETAAIRESFLEAAQFVGREAEIARLTVGLRDARVGSGSVWLVGGESGIGKTRLIDELRSVALVRGLNVLRGNAVSEGSRPFQVWRDILRRAVISTPLSDLEAGTLKALIFDIDSLIGRPVPDAPDLGPQANGERLLSTIETVVHKQNQPTLIILEDLQWASEGLDVMARISRSIEDFPVMVVGSYRDDERHDVPDLVPQAQVLKLNRLARESIARLGESMLGEPGHNPAVIDLIQRETDGNPFFMVEVVRTLVEEAGQRALVGSRPLPETVFAAGILSVVQRRLGQIPARYRPLLRLAAVSGKQIDLPVLAHLEPNVDIDLWLNACSDAAVLVIQDGQWQFAHDKLREGLLTNLSSNQRITLHRQVAESIEGTATDIEQQATALAHHWAEVGDAGKEAHYSALAGEQALLSGAYKDTIRLLSRTLELAALSGDIDPLQQARWERQLGEAHYAMGQPVESASHLKNALALLGKPMPTMRPGLVIGLLGQVLRQVLHRVLPARFVESLGKDKAALLEAALAYETYAAVSYFAGDGVTGTYAALWSLNLSEMAGPSPVMARACATTGMAAGAVLRSHSLAGAYLRRAREIARSDKGDLYALARALSYTGIYATGVARWDEANDMLEQAEEIANQLGQRRAWEQNRGSVSAVADFRADHARSESIGRDLYEAARRRGDTEFQLIRLLRLTNTLSRMSKAHMDEIPSILDHFQNARYLIHMSKAHMDEIPSILEVIQYLLEEESYPLLEMWANGSLALMYLRQGKTELALEYAGLAFEHAAGTRPIGYYLFEAYASCPAVYLTLWEERVEAGRLPAECEDLQRAARKSCKDLHRFARSFPVGLPRAWRWQGVYDWLSGDPRKAHRAWQKSLAEAERLDMPYERELTHYEIGRHLEAGDPDRQKHLVRSVEFFAQLDAAYDLARAQEALEQS